MIQIAQATLHIAPADLSATVQTWLGQPMRREGLFAKLCLCGIAACLKNVPEQTGTTALLWASSRGAQQEVEKIIDLICHQQTLPMPFDFVASQASVSAVYAAKRIGSVKTGLYLPGGEWPQMRDLASCWLQERRFDRVLCGRVEQADPNRPDSEHLSEWVLLAARPVEGETT
ncbi:MAG: hypothetical protein JNM52_05610 [Betaproteobacteria bacterium]|nr:hypothetical protein [Betaproteobacteria bacterium]